MSAGLYAYGIVAGGSLAAPPGGPGIDPAHAPELFESGDLAAVVSRVDVSEFEGEALQRNAAVPEWLERKVRAHERVLDEVLAHTHVVPMRFGAIFSSSDALRTLLDAHSETLRASLARVRGCSEWGVKVHCDAPRLVEALAGSSAQPASGRGYLEQKKARLEAEAGVARAAAEVTAAAHSSLAALAEDAATPAPRASVVLNGAYLVSDDRREAFMQRVAELQQRHGAAFTFEVTGPWPPYNFTSADVSGPLVGAR